MMLEISKNNRAACADDAFRYISLLSSAKQRRKFQILYYYMRNFCNLIGLEQ